jgi:hypothetical protein
MPTSDWINMKASRFVRQVRSARLAIASAAALGLILALPGNAQAAVQPPVGLGTATTYAVLAATTVTNTGATRISGNLGLNPGAAAAVTGFPPGIVTNGVIHAADAEALQAQADLTIAYLDAAGRTAPVVVSRDLGGQTLVAGLYKAPVDLRLTGTVTLDAHNDPNAVFIFQAGRGLVTASTSRVNLVNGASSCNVFWQVTSSATLGSDSTMRGSILALTSISLATRATVDGRVLARNGSVTLQANTIRRSPCVVGAAAATPTATATATATPTPQVSALPTGAIAAGDGSTSGGNDGLGLLSGVLVFAGIGGATVVALRRRRRLNI